MTDRLALLPEKLRDMRELPHPAGAIQELNSWCSYHGPQQGLACAACDEAHGINRAALANEARIRALVQELEHLGIRVGPVAALGDKEPGPNEAKQVMTVEEQKEALADQLRSLGVPVNLS